MNSKHLYLYFLLRYLYVNTRPWPENYVISNALEPPPIAQEIDIHVIDLMTLKRVGNMLRAHKAYTPSTECFFIFLDVCDDYVARYSVNGDMLLHVLKIITMLFLLLQWR